MSVKESQVLAACKRREQFLKGLQTHPIAQKTGNKPLAVIFTAPNYIRNNDVEHLFRPGSDMMYLTAFNEPQSILVLRPGAEDGQESILFTRPKNAEKELWDGFRYGPQGAKDIFKVDAAYNIEEFDQQLGQLINGHTSLWANWGEFPDQDARLLKAYRTTRLRTRKSGIYPCVLGELAEVLHEQRQIKDEVEIASMRQAGQISGQAFERVMAATQPGLNESDIAAYMQYQFSRAVRNGQGTGPSSLVVQMLAFYITLKTINHSKMVTFYSSTQVEKSTCTRLTSHEPGQLTGNSRHHKKTFMKLFLLHK